MDGAGRKAIFWDFDGTLTDASGCVRPEVPGVLTACAFLGHKNYILTNGPAGWEGVLDRLKLRRYFSGVVVSGDVGFAMPDVRIFRKAEAIANFPSRLWMVSGSPVAVHGAKGAGWGAIHVAKPGSPHSGADYTVRSLDEIPKLL